MSVTVILPSLNPDEKMVRTVTELQKNGFDDIVVVNDGSDAAHLAPFEQVSKLSGVTVLTHEVNRGKGRAMKTAFSYVMEHRSDISGVVTVDGDGQHLPKDIKRCVQRMEEEGDKVILGVRDFSLPGVPPKSRFGNNLTKAVFRFVCGLAISDTQTGLRAIPFSYLQAMTDVEGERFEYETNQLLALKKLRIGIAEVVIDTVYIEENASTHFRPIRDSLKIYAVIFKFIGSSLASFIVDILLFTLLNVLLSKTTPMTGETVLAIATAGARLLSSVFNYTVNRRMVFRSEASVGSSLWKYYVLAVCQMALSYGLVYLFSIAVFHLSDGSLWETVIKLIVDVCLFLLSFQIQQRWVFAGKKK